jgi:hypothetical protein
MKIVRLECPSSLDDIYPENDNIDIFVTLDDGRKYSFGFSTPANLYWCMDNEGLDYSFGYPEIFVRTLTFENIEKALSALLAEDAEKWLSIYGALQRPLVRDTDEEDQTIESNQNFP